MNITDYVKKYGGATFDERPLNEVDSLVLSELAYLNFTGIVGCGAPAKTIGDLAPDTERLIFDTLLPKSNKKLLTAAAASRRFKNIKVGYFNERNDKKREIRFAAVTFKISEKLIYVAFRGTDVTILGWKEDFNMAFCSKIPSQQLAAQYLKKISLRQKTAVIVGGHSKGGNLAVYAAVHSPAEIKKRIICVYNHDGPGFPNSMDDKSGYRALKGRIFKTVPHDSLIGILLFDTRRHKVVVSKSVLIGQHNPFAWEVENSESFKQLPETTEHSRRTDEALRKFIAEMDRESRRKFVEALFAVIDGSGALSVPEFRRGIIKKLRGMKAAYANLSDDGKAMIRSGGAKFIRIWLNVARNRYK